MGLSRHILPWIAIITIEKEIQLNSKTKHYFTFMIIVCSLLLHSEINLPPSPIFVIGMVQQCLTF